MPVTKVVLSGGGWQDPHANPVANGTLVLTLSQDAVITANNNQVAPLIVTFPLDANGNLINSPTPDVWGNDVLSPSGTFYTAEVLNAGGSRVWGPEKWIIQGSSQNVGGIPPATTPGLTLNVPVLEVNGTKNAVQSLLNIVNGNNLTWADLGNGSVQGTVARVSSFNYVMDGAGSVVSTGAAGQIDSPVNCTITGWVLTADQSGSAVVDVLRSTYAGFPTTSSIAGADKPTLSSVQKNENLAVSLWTTAISAGDQIQFNVNSATTVTRLNLTILVTVP